MKTLALQLLTLLLIPTLTCAVELKQVAAVARISAVTVYPDRALTTRTATLNLKAGSYLVTFDNLPALIQDDSIRVEGKGSAGVTIAGMEIKRTFLERSGEKRVQEIEAEIRALEQRSGELDAKKAGFISQKTFLESIRVAWGERISRELATGRPTTAELQEAAGFIGSGVTRIEEQSLGITSEQNSLTEKIDALRRQRDEVIGSLRKENKRVEVLIDVLRDGNLTLDLATVISRAGWVPAYDLRLAEDAKSAGLTFRALVRQQTGEDWNNVDLTLSTARPAIGGAPPELAPWHLALLRPQPLATRSMMLMGSAAPELRKSAEMYAESALAADSFADEEPATIETARLSEEESSIAFHLPRPLDIPTDGSQYGSVVAIVQLPVTMEFLAIPKLSPFVFLKSELVNQAGFPLLPGKVNSFIGNTYTGSSQLKKVAAGEKFELFFGADDQVTVKREELKQHKEAGLFSSNRASFRYRIELNNFRKEPVNVTLLDQLPLADDTEIRISLDEPSLKPDEVGADGKLTWKIPLQAGEKKELSFGLIVDYPKDRQITGL